MSLITLHQLFEFSRHSFQHNSNPASLFQLSWELDFEWTSEQLSFFFFRREKGCKMHTEDEILTSQWGWDVTSCQNTQTSLLVIFVLLLSGFLCKTPSDNLYYNKLSSVWTELKQDKGVDEEEVDYLQNAVIPHMHKQYCSFKRSLWMHTGKVEAEWGGKL